MWMLRTKSQHGATPLQAACAGGHVAVVQALLDNGATVSIRGGLYSSSLGAALAGRHAEIAQLLVDAGAQETENPIEREDTPERLDVRDVYTLMRCPGKSCSLKPYCWYDAKSNKRYRVLTSQLKLLIKYKIIKYKENGNRLVSHDDVPEKIRQKLYRNVSQCQ